MNSNIDYKLEAMKSGIREYIATLMGICENSVEKNPFNKNYNECFNSLNTLYDEIMKANTSEQVDKIKNLVIKTEKIIENIPAKNNDHELTGREKSLIDRGYSEDLVKELTYYSDEEINNIANILLGVITKNCNRTDNPICLFIGGQPGAGKSTLSMQLKTSGFGNAGAVEIGMDNYRSFHPRYEKIEKAINEHWQGKEETENDTKGNDIADFTHRFAGEMADILYKKLISKDTKEQYNIIFEWGLRNTEEPIKAMEELRKKGYLNIVEYIVVHKDISYEACQIRANVMNQQDHIIRRVPKSFHDLCVNTLPAAADELFQIGYKDKECINKFTLNQRDGKEIWNILDDNMPSETYTKYLNELELSKGFENKMDDAMFAYKNESQGFKIFN